MAGYVPEKKSPKPLEIRPTYELLDSVIGAIQVRSDKPELPTGISDLDDLIWGLHPSELVVIGARPSHGKTSLKVQVAWNLAKLGIPVVFLSLEMSSEQIVERIFCNEMSVHGWRLRTGNPQEVKRAIELKDKFLTKLVSSTIQIIDSHGYTTDEVEYIIKELGPKVIFIDHLQRIRLQGSSRYDALSNYVSRLKELAMKYKISIVLGSQVNRAGAKEADAINNMKGTGEIEEAADALLICKWLKRDDADYENLNDYEVLVSKQRNGPCDKKIIYFDSRYFKFSNNQSQSTVIRQPDYKDRVAP